MTKRKEVTVTLARPNETKVRVLKRFNTVRQAEVFIGQCENADPTGVLRGDYGIDASEQYTNRRREDERDRRST